MVRCDGGCDRRDGGQAKSVSYCHVSDNSLLLAGLGLRGPRLGPLSSRLPLTKANFLQGSLMAESLVVRWCGGGGGGAIPCSRSAATVCWNW